ncbi:MAG: hypothetical protein NZ534_09770, partial [Bacteroidia bacterium]|nr:hypothetical protein [Bacteroidia bacterium]
MRNCVATALAAMANIAALWSQPLSPAQSKLRPKSAMPAPELRAVPIVNGAGGAMSPSKFKPTTHLARRLALKAADPEARAVFEANGTPSFLWGKNLFAALNVLAPHDPAPGYARDPLTLELVPSPLVRHTLDGLQSLAGVLKSRCPQSEWKFVRVETDEAGRRHVRMSQQKDGIAVYGSDMVVHYTPEGYCYAINGRFEPTSDVMPSDFTADLQLCAQNALSDLARRTAMRQLTEAERRLLNYHGPIARPVIYPHEGKHLPVYQFTLRPNFIERWEYFVHAQTGEVVDFFNHTCTNGPTTATGQNLFGQNVNINVYLYNGVYIMMDAARPMFNAQASDMPQRPVGVILTLDARNTQGESLFFITSSDNTWSDRTAVSAHDNALKCYDYYRTTHNRNSIDGQGGNIISAVHVADEDGGGLDNAFWNGEIMGYGDGREAFEPLAKGLDVAGHE